MPRSFVVLCIAVAFVGLATATESSLASEIVIRFQPGVADPLSGHTGGQINSFTFAPTAFAGSLSAAGVLALERLFPAFQHTDVNTTNIIGEPIVLPDLADVYIATLSEGGDVANATSQLRSLSEVVYADTIGAIVAASDPLFALQWGLHNTRQTLCGVQSVADVDINAPEAWALAPNQASVRVGVLDSGIDTSHPEFGGRAVGGESFAGGASTSDVWGHGTAVSGIIGASGDNGLGVAGVAWHSELVSIKVFNDQGNGNSDLSARGIEWARTHGILHPKHEL